MALNIIYDGWKITIFLSLSSFQLPFFLVFSPLLPPPLAALVAFVAFCAGFAGIVVTVAYFKYFH